MISASRFYLFDHGLQQSYMEFLLNHLYFEDPGTYRRLLMHISKYFKLRFFVFFAFKVASFLKINIILVIFLITLTSDPPE